MFLRPPQPRKPTRRRRGACGGVGLASLAAVGLLCGELAVGGSNSCGLRGIFGHCQDQSKANAENVQRLVEFQKSLTDYVTEIVFNTDGKLFLVVNELAALKGYSLQLPRLTIKTGLTFKINWLFMRKIFIFYDTVTSFFSLFSNLILILIQFLLYFQ